MIVGGKQTPTAKTFEMSASQPDAHEPSLRMSTQCQGGATISVSQG